MITSDHSDLVIAAIGCESLPSHSITLQAFSGGIFCAISRCSRIYIISPPRLMTCVALEVSPAGASYSRSRPWHIIHLHAQKQETRRCRDGPERPAAAARHRHARTLQTKQLRTTPSAASQGGTFSISVPRFLGSCFRFVHAAAAEILHSSAGLGFTRRRHPLGSSGLGARKLSVS
jgi:hypothetical protein